MTAKQLVDSKGKDLIGRMVFTQPMGDYPGGLAKVVEIHPDPAAPEIVCNVEHAHWKNQHGDSFMGIFDYEDIALIAD